MSTTTFNQAELAQYNGENGQAAYVAVDGVVYDVTNIAAWAGGKHHGNLAGQDLTTVIDNQSPHGRKVLAKLTVVGQYQA
ncbi:cytochrome B5 [Lactobacillus sp. CBA3606]|uniref:cytochrome b5 domain-containing protein n=1 Tax=Lactobacillus sp. CBA3606 TaxID=2099789 RepID=UPI000CFB3C25|nr:cytochrome b5 domain-containing protein [Lactobacillus sp. CBA3606]AVK63732.1 cytochrome B5 [Lactobacillus sp. CBA3606]